MEAPELKLRMATPADAAALLEIYAPYVRETAVTYEYEVPTETEFAARVAKTLEAYPYLAAEQGGELVGYAYAGRFHARKAYDWSAEASIYVRRDLRGRGVGRRLYGALEALLTRQNVQSVHAVIAYPEREDEYLTWASVRFHTRMGYEQIGRSRRCAYKFSRWYDMVWMEKTLGTFPELPAPFVPLPMLPRDPSL